MWCFIEEFFSIARFTQQIAVYFVPKLDFGAFTTFDYYLCASTYWEALKCGQQSDVFWAKK